jgi:predicted methyltransferase
MKQIRRALWCGVAIGIAGCGQVAERADRDVGGGDAPKQGEQKTMHQDHARRHGAFADADKAAVKWNSPERDEWQHPEEIVAALALRAGATVADIGAGTGYMVAHLSKAVGESGTVIAVDAEEAMIEYLSKRVEALRPATVVPRKVGVDDPKLPNESVDAILILEVWHHMGGRLEYAKKLHAALKPQGRLVVVESEPESAIGPPKEMRIAPKEAQAELAAAGFRAEVAGESMPRHYMIVANKD